MRTPYFLSQIVDLERKYRQIQSDMDDFCIQEILDPSGKELFYPYRKKMRIPRDREGIWRDFLSIHHLCETLRMRNHRTAIREDVLVSILRYMER